MQKEIEGFKFGKVWYVDANGISKQRYRCAQCRVVTINYVRTEKEDKEDNVWNHLRVSLIIWKPL